MLPKGMHCPGCDDKEKEYFITAGSKGNNLVSPVISSAAARAKVSQHCLSS